MGMEKITYRELQRISWEKLKGKLPVVVTVYGVVVMVIRRDDAV